MLHVPHSLAPSTIMSSHQGPYYYPDQSLFYEGDSGSPAARQSHSPGPSWIPSFTSAQGGYSQPHQSLDQVGNLLEVSHGEDTHYSYHRHLDYPLQATPLQDPTSRADPAYNDDIRFGFDNLPFYPCSDFDSGHSQLQGSHTTYEPIQEFPRQPLTDREHAMSDLTHTLGVHHAQDMLPPQTSQAPTALVYPYSSSTPLLSLDRGGPVYGVAMRSARPTSQGLTVDTGRTEHPNADTGPHSHPPPVATSSNHNFSSGASRSLPSSPDRKRLFPSTTAEELSPTRRVAPRTDRAWSVHSASSDSHRRSLSTDVFGRGPFIPQDRYTTSSVSSRTTAEQYPHITFDLENPDQVGVPISDVLNKSGGYNRIRDRTQAFNHMGRKTFTLRLQWPGYKPWSKTIAALDWTKSRAPITRVKLAEAVATAVRDMLQRKRDEPCDPDCAEWNIGPNGIQLDQLCLVALYHVSRGSWQPQLCLLQPRQH